jgi:hypothetical protein
VPRPALALLALPILALGACSSTGLVGHALTPEAAATPSSGVRYRVAKDLVEVATTVTERTTTRYAGQADGGVAIEEAREIERRAAVAIVSVPDPDHLFRLDLAARGLAHHALRVALRPNGLLESINAESTGRGGEALVAIGKAIGLAAGMAPAVGLAAPAPDRGCTPADTREMPANVRGFLAEDRDGCKLWSEIGTARKRIDQLERDRRRLLDRSGSETGEGLKTVEKQLDLVRQEIDDERRALAPREARLAGLLESFLAGKAIGTRTTVTEHRERFDRADLVLEDGAVGDRIHPGMTPDLVEAVLTDKPGALEFFARTGTVVTLESIDRQERAEPPPQPAGTARIYFREPRLRRVRVFVLAGALDAPELTLQIDQIQPLVLGGDALAYVEFRESAFAERKLALAFDERGRPVKLERASTSAPAGVASAVIQAAAAARDEYTTTLDKLADAQASRRKIAIDRQLRRLDQLERQKAVVDAEVALEIATGTRDARLRQFQLEAELGALQADVDLASAGATTSQETEVARLKAAVDLLRQQVALIEAEQGLERARR